MFDCHNVLNHWCCRGSKSVSAYVYVSKAKSMYLKSVKNPARHVLQGKKTIFSLAKQEFH